MKLQPQSKLTHPQVNVCRARQTVPPRSEVVSGVDRTVDARYARILDIADDAIISIDSQQRITLFNRGAERIFGYAAGELVGKPLAVLIPQRWACTHRKHVEAFAQSSTLARLMAERREVFGRRKDGEEFPAEASISKLDIEGEQILTVILRDISERRRAEEAMRRTEEALRKSEQQWKDVFENNPTMYFMVDRAGKILSVNPFGAEQLGYTVNELVGSAVLNIFYEPDRTAVQRNVASCLKQLGRSMSWELRKIRKDGTVLWVRETARTVMRDDQPIVLVACEDITDRKRAEEAVRRSEAFLAEGQRLSRTGSWAWNASTGELIWSREKFRVLGLEPELTKPSLEVFWERVHPEDRLRLKEAFDSAVRNKKDFEQEYRIVTPDWSIRHIHDVGHAVVNEAGELIEFIGSAMDITDRKRAEERAQSQNEAIRSALNAFVEELDVDRFLEHVITDLTKQFEAASSELWLFDDSTGMPHLYFAYQEGRVSKPAAGSSNLEAGDEHIIRQPSNLGRIPRIIEIPARGSLLEPSHRKWLRQQGITSLMVVPLVLGEQDLGFFELHFQATTPLSTDDLDHAQALVHHATLALQLSRLAHRTEQIAVTEERNRLAREIHDTLAQAFAGIVLHSQAMETAFGAGKLRARESLSQIQKLARSGLDEARRSVQALRPKALDGNTLLQALAQATKRLSEDAKLSCEFKQRGKALGLSAEVQNELFRIAQEAMTNVSKHARARSVGVSLNFEGNQVILTIQDDGVGMPRTKSRKRKQGYGLSTMHERAQRIGGRLEIKNPPDGGTAIRVLVPQHEMKRPQPTP